MLIDSILRTQNQQHILNKKENAVGNVKNLSKNP